MSGLWYLLIGCLLIVMALTSRLVERLPMSGAVVYLAIGVAAGPLGVGLLDIDMRRDGHTLELMAEVGVLISLFAVGLKIKVAFSRRAWRVPLYLATTGMALTMGLIALAAVAVLALPWPLALLLGAVLAPTDPVLASEVQLRHVGDPDRLRFALTTEGGLNDGTAFPGVMLALVLLGARDGGSYLWLWLARDLIWATVAGIAVGTACGLMVARVLARLKRRGPLQFEEFIVLGVIALSYGLALVVEAYGFLAVFAAGVALAHGERRWRAQPASAPSSGTPAHAEPVIAPRLLALTEQFERLAEVALVLAVGALLAQVRWSLSLLLFAALVLLVVRPLAVLAVVSRRDTSAQERRLLAWFGVRGIGSVYYLAFALNHGVPAVAGPWLLEAVVVTIALSIVLHGISATPLMARYQRARQRTAGERER